MRISITDLQAGKIREALRAGRDVAELAAEFGLTADELCAAVAWPAWKPDPENAETRQR